MTSCSFVQLKFVLEMLCILKRYSVVDKVSAYVKHTKPCRRLMQLQHRSNGLTEICEDA